MIRKTILITIISILSYSCSEKSRTGNLESEIEKLRTENDSLKNILAEINQKYVFDKVIVRDIPNLKNTYTMNTKIKGELVFVGYNFNNNTSIILTDSIAYENGETLYKPDTLQLYQGGFKYEKDVTKNRTIIKGLVKSENKYGKPLDAIFTTSILTRKN